MTFLKALTRGKDFGTARSVVFYYLVDYSIRLEKKRAGKQGIGSIDVFGVRHTNRRARRTRKRSGRLGCFSANVSVLGKL